MKSITIVLNEKDLFIVCSKDLTTMEAISMLQQAVSEKIVEHDEVEEAKESGE
jgi:hypothetical protein